MMNKESSNYRTVPGGFITCTGSFQNDSPNFSKTRVAT